MQGRNIFDPLTLEGDDKFAGAVELRAARKLVPAACMLPACQFNMLMHSTQHSAIHIAYTAIAVAAPPHNQNSTQQQSLLCRPNSMPDMLPACYLPAGLTLLVIGTVAGAAALGSLVWVLWRWLALGRVPKPVVALRRLARAMRAATIDGAAAAPPDTGVSKKHLLDVELELTGKPRRRSHAGGIEDAAAWSKVRISSRQGDAKHVAAAWPVPACLWLNNDINGCTKSAWPGHLLQWFVSSQVIQNSTAIRCCRCHRCCVVVCAAPILAAPLHTRGRWGRG